MSVIRLIALHNTFLGGTMILIINDKNDVAEGFLKIVEKSKSMAKLKSAVSIVIKPNLSGSLDWSSNSVTGLYLLKLIINIILKINDKAFVYIAESDSRYNRFAYLKFQRLNLPKALGLVPESAGRVFLLDMTRDHLIANKNRDSIFFSERNGFMALSEKLMKADYLINLTNVKSHLICTYTGACKNLFGCLSNFDKSIYHGNIHKVIHDVNLVVKPDINLVDGFTGMQGNGPTKGEHVDFGFMVFSDSAVEADFTAAGLVGINPRKVKYLRLIADSMGGSKSLCIPDAIAKIKKPEKLQRIKLRLKGFIAAVGYKVLRRGI